MYCNTIWVQNVNKLYVVIVGELWHVPNKPGLSAMMVGFANDKGIGASYCDYWLSLKNETGMCCFVVGGASRSQLYDGVGVGVFTSHRPASNIADPYVGAYLL